MPNDENLAPETRGAGEQTSPVDGMPAPPTKFEELFPEPKQVSTGLCSWNTCLAGHRWPVTMQVGGCPGCGGATIAIKMENCPFCNEPVERRSIRIDHIPRGGAILSRCKGESMFETLDVEMECHHWQEGEATTKRFEEKRADERAKQQQLAPRG